MALPVLLVVASVGAAEAQLRGYNPANSAYKRSQDVSIIHLIANPQAWDGKHIRVIGFLRLEFECNQFGLCNVRGNISRGKTRTYGAVQRHDQRHSPFRGVELYPSRKINLDQPIDSFRLDVLWGWLRSSDQSDRRLLRQSETRVL